MPFAPQTALKRRRRLAFVVAPDGQAGGGMGRVKDYMLSAGPDRLGDLELLPLVTRDGRGMAVSLLLTLRTIARIWVAAARGELAFVHVQFGDRGSAVRKAAVVLATRLVGGKAALHLHAVELEAQWRRAGPPLRWLIALPFHAASVDIVLGARWRRWLVEELSVASAKVEIVWNGVPIAEAGVVRRAHDGPVRALFLGNLIERKGVSDLIAAFAAIPAGLNWRLTLAGGGDIERYRALAERAGVAERLIFAGWVDQTRARALLAAADFLVLPSYDEGLPLVILEALGAGAPVLCTPIGAIPEVLRDGETALFCPPGDGAALAERLEELIADASLRESLSRAGLALYARRFSLDAFLDSLFAVYARQFGHSAESRLDLARAP